tara:strand:- start:1173 stop:1559 length:387 start_codon:yes stop_codon:yes gene_type:complete
MVSQTPISYIHPNTPVLDPALAGFGQSTFATVDVIENTEAKVNSVPVFCAVQTESGHSYVYTVHETIRAANRAKKNPEDLLSFEEMLLPVEIFKPTLFERIKWALFPDDDKCLFRKSDLQEINAYPSE